VSHIRVERTIARPPDDVWRHLADVADHVHWMADAAEIRFTGDRREGVGATFECETRVGPLRTVDRMVVTEWEPGRAMGVDHRGLVTGTGRFSLEPAGSAGAAAGAGAGASGGAGATVLTWDEDLRFPWWLGGPVASVAARPVLRRLWSGNLRRFSERVETWADG
jgi:carbon monoxide dehydrogenase subunit G